MERSNEPDEKIGKVCCSEVNVIDIEFLSPLQMKIKTKFLEEQLSVSY